MNIAPLAATRHTCKAYDPLRKIPETQFEQLRTLLHLSPSSVNSQPWHFIVASTEAGKQRIAQATQHPVHSANTPKILKASHVIVFCTRTLLDESYLATVLAQEARDGRFPTPEAQALQNKGRRFYVDQHRFDAKDTQAWMEKQLYIALGALLLGAAALGIDATPIEGFDPKALNEELALRKKGLTSVVIVALGYRSEEDFNARLPKSRLPIETVFSDL